MLNVVRTAASIDRRIALISCILFAGILALLPVSAAAQCSTGWDANVKMGVRQVGVRYTLNFEMEQRGRVITGNAYGTVDNRTGGVDSLKGTIDGTLEGDNFNVQVFWTNGQTGIYNAKVLPSGRLDGEGYEKGSPGVRVSWNSTGVLKCPPPPPKVIKSSGKAKAPTPPKPPFITASQPISIPNMPYSSVFIGWDGGPDHPNVEVWLSINSSVEIPAFSMDIPAQSPVFKQPKVPAIELKLNRGRHYKFVLRGSGKTLSSVAFALP